MPNMPAALLWEEIAGEALLSLSLSLSLLSPLSPLSPSLSLSMSLSLSPLSPSLSLSLLSLYLSLSSLLLFSVLSLSLSLFLSLGIFSCTVLKGHGCVSAV